MIGDPIPVGDNESEPVEQIEEYGICPECGGRGSPCGETETKAFLKCGYCDEHFSQEI